MESSYCKLQYLVIDFNSRYQHIILRDQVQGNEFDKFFHVVWNMRDGELHNAPSELKDLMLCILNQFSDELSDFDKILNAYSIKHILKFFFPNKHIYKTRMSEYKYLRLGSMQLCDKFNSLMRKAPATVEEMIQMATYETQATNVLNEVVELSDKENEI